MHLFMLIHPLLVTCAISFTVYTVLYTLLLVLYGSIYNFTHLIFMSTLYIIHILFHLYMLCVSVRKKE